MTDISNLVQGFYASRDEILQSIQEATEQYIGKMVNMTVTIYFTKARDKHTTYNYENVIFNGCTNDDGCLQVHWTPLKKDGKPAKRSEDCPLTKYADVQIESVEK